MKRDVCLDLKSRWHWKFMFWNSWVLSLNNINNGNHQGWFFFVLYSAMVENCTFSVYISPFHHLIIPFQHRMLAFGRALFWCCWWRFTKIRFHTEYIKNLQIKLLQPNIKFCFYVFYTFGLFCSFSIRYFCKTPHFIMTSNMNSSFCNEIH